MTPIYLDEEKIGKIFAYFPQLGVAAVELHGFIKIGDKIRIIGSKTNFIQVVESMEIYSKPVTKADPGQKIGVKVKYKCRKGDIIHKIYEY
ncbi:MAG: translation elongation factor-like protein [Candidatus Hodarchaeota archaeon]